MKTIGILLILAATIASCDIKHECYCYDIDVITLEVTDEAVIETTNSCRNIKEGYDDTYKKHWASCKQVY